MKGTGRTLAVACAWMLAATLASSPVAAQNASIKGDIVKDLTSMKEMMNKIAAAMPDDKYAYKSTPAQRDFAAQVMHVAQVNVMLGGMVGGKTAAPMIDAKATKKADVIKAMDASFDYAIALANEQTDQTMLEGVNAQFLGRSTRARVFYFLAGHTWDIYGQMVVYLRLNGTVPPASQRP